MARRAHDRHSPAARAWVLVSYRGYRDRCAHTRGKDGQGRPASAPHTHRHHHYCVSCARDRRGRNGRPANLEQASAGVKQDVRRLAAGKLRAKLRVRDAPYARVVEVEPPACVCVCVCVYVRLYYAPMLRWSARKRKGVLPSNKRACAHPCAFHWLPLATLANPVRLTTLSRARAHTNLGCWQSLGLQHCPHSVHSLLRTTGVREFIWSFRDPRACVRV